MLRKTYTLLFVTSLAVLLAAILAHKGVYLGWALLLWLVARALMWHEDRRRPCRVGTRCDLTGWAIRLPPSISPQGRHVTVNL